jgi:Arm DNA-binding domain
MLTNLAIKNAAPRAKPYKMLDGGGLYLLVNPKGHRYWRFDFRFSGKRCTLALGVYPAVSLADARTKRNAAKDLLAEGRDPAVQRRIEKLTGGLSAGNSFQEVADEWVAKLEREGRAKTTLSKIRWLLSFATPLICTARSQHPKLRTAPRFLNQKQWADYCAPLRALKASPQRTRR